MEARGVGWSNGEEAAPDHSDGARSRVKSKSASSGVHSVPGGDTCVDKCARLCVRFVSLLWPDVSNNHQLFCSRSGLCRDIMMGSLY